MQRPRLLILSFTNAARDPRVFRQALHLRNDFDVTVLSRGNPELERVDFHPVEYRKAESLLVKLHRAGAMAAGDYTPFLKRFRPSESGGFHERRFDIVLVNDALPLPLGFEIARGCPVVFDAHEYYPEQSRTLSYRLFFQKAFTRLLHDHIPATAGMTTVCPGIADIYERRFGKRPDVVYNAPEYCRLTPSKPAVDGTIRMIHHGIAAPGRRLEVMIRTMELLGTGFSLDLMLANPDSPYYKKLLNVSSRLTNVSFRPPVKMSEICHTINDYDIGMYILPETSTNNAYALPNKFFEFIQARLAIAIGPSREMASIAKEFDLGVISKDFTAESMAAAVSVLTPSRLDTFKSNAHRAAEIYNADASIAALRNVLSRALEG